MNNMVRTSSDSVALEVLVSAHHIEVTASLQMPQEPPQQGRKEPNDGHSVCVVGSR